jgi:hypothetical protein
MALEEKKSARAEAKNSEKLTKRNNLEKATTREIYNEVSVCLKLYLWARGYLELCRFIIIFLFALEKKKKHNAVTCY